MVRRIFRFCVIRRPLRCRRAETNRLPCYTCSTSYPTSPACQPADPANLSGQLPTNPASLPREPDYIEPPGPGSGSLNPASLVFCILTYLPYLLSILTILTYHTYIWEQFPAAKCFKPNRRFSLIFMNLHRFIQN